MSNSDLTGLVVVGVGFVLVLTGIGIWQRRAFEHRDLSKHPDGPDPQKAEDTPFNDGDRIYRVTALPARHPVWLFRPDSGPNGSGGYVGDSLVGAIVGGIISAMVRWLVRAVIARSDPRWKVVVDRKDKPNFAVFHAVQVEFFNSRTEAESRRDEFVHAWSPNWKFATTPRLSHKEIRAARQAAPAYVPDSHADAVR